MSRDNISRRRFIGQLAAAAPIGAAILSRQAAAQDLPKLTEDDPAAIALQYVHDAANVDPAKSPRYQAGQSCSNCLQVQGEEGAEFRPCAIFPGKLVASKGWCSVWVAKP